MIHNLPEEIIAYIYKIYFSHYVLNKIKPKCFRSINIGGCSQAIIKCGFKTIDGSFCMACNI